MLAAICVVYSDQHKMHEQNAGIHIFNGKIYDVDTNFGEYTVCI